MSPSIKMKEYIEPELSGIFRVKMVAKNMVLGSPGTHFMHMRVKVPLGTYYAQSSGSIQAIINSELHKKNI